LNVYDKIYMFKLSIDYFKINNLIINTYVQIFFKCTFIFNNSIKNMNCLVDWNEIRSRSWHWISFQIIYSDSIYDIIWHNKLICENLLFKTWAKIKLWTFKFSKLELFLHKSIWVLIFFSFEFFSYNKWHEIST
jgi:hypothetical protein